jgi:hypothetical protein
VARNRRFDESKVHGDELVRISEELGDEDLKYEALHHRWGHAYFTGMTADMLASRQRSSGSWKRVSRWRRSCSIRRRLLS